jgi:hypothetical protein
MNVCFYGHLLQFELQRMTQDPDTLEDKEDLCHMFPDIDKDMLQAVLTANGNSLEKTIENINAQMQCALGKRPQTVSSLETLVERGRHLLDQASQEHCKMSQKNRVCARLCFRSPLHTAFSLVNYIYIYEFFCGYTVFVSPKTVWFVQSSRSKRSSSLRFLLCMLCLIPSVHVFTSLPRLLFPCSILQPA